MMTLSDEFPQTLRDLRPKFGFAEPDRIKTQMARMVRNPGFKPCGGCRKIRHEKGLVSPVNGHSLCHRVCKWTSFSTVREARFRQGLSRFENGLPRWGRNGIVGPCDILSAPFCPLLFWA